MESEIYLRRAQTEQDFEQFVQFPQKIYEDKPELAVLAINERKDFLLRQKSNLNQNSEVQCFTAFEKRKLAGTIVTIINKNFNLAHCSSTGFLAFFEVIPNRMVSLALFDIAHYWLKKEGMDTLVGYVSFLPNKSPGHSIKGSTLKPFLPLAPDYYVDFIESYGFKKVSEQLKTGESDQKSSRDMFQGVWENSRKQRSHDVTPEATPAYRKDTGLCWHSYEYRMA